MRVQVAFTQLFSPSVTPARKVGTKLLSTGLVKRRPPIWSHPGLSKPTPLRIREYGSQELHFSLICLPLKPPKSFMH